MNSRANLGRGPGAPVHGICSALMALALSTNAAQAPSPPIRSVEVSIPRDYGIVMGETFTDEIRVKVESGYELETAHLPQPGSAVGDFLEVRQSRWSKQSEGGGTVYRINLTYQVFKGVREAETLTVPSVPLRFRYGDQIAEMEAPPWNITLTPLIPPAMPDEEVKLRGDLPALLDSSGNHRLEFSAYLAVLAGLGIYAAWKLGLPPFRRNASPFVRAASGLRKLARQPADLAAYRQGAKLVHAALNETAGRTLFSGQLEGFLAAHPRYSAFRSELSSFFSVSDRLFFTDEEELPVDYSLRHMEALCLRLAAAGSDR